MLVRCLALLQVPQYTVFPDIPCSLLLVPHTHGWIRPTQRASPVLLGGPSFFQKSCQGMDGDVGPAGA